MSFKRSLQAYHRNSSPNHDEKVLFRLNKISSALSHLTWVDLIDKTQLTSPPNQSQSKEAELKNVMIAAELSQVQSNSSPPSSIPFMNPLEPFEEEIARLLEK